MRHNLRGELAKILDVDVLDHGTGCHHEGSQDDDLV
jgi:hypothetical protein